MATESDASAGIRIGRLAISHASVEVRRNADHKIVQLPSVHV
jgi:hypothetical protein